MFVSCQRNSETQTDVKANDVLFAGPPVKVEEPPSLGMTSNLAHNAGVFSNDASVISSFIKTKIVVISKIQARLIMYLSN